MGDILRKERERQNLSMKDVEEEISIRALYIAAIEEGKYETVPGEVYLKGFIKTYANFLQLDGAELLKLYYEEKAPKVPEMSQVLQVPQVPQVPQVSEMSPVAQSTMPVEENEMAVEEERPPEKMSLREKREIRRQSSFSMAKLLVGLVLVICIGGVGYMLGDAKQETKVTSVQTERKAEPKEEAKAPAPAKVQKKETASPAQQDKFIEIQAKYTGNCWTKVEADGKVVYEGTAKNGEALSWKAERNLIITAGNAGAIEVVSKGMPLGKLGNPGEVVTKKFEKEASVANK